MQLCIDASASMPFCKRVLRALYALVSSKRSAPPSVSSARKRNPESFTLSRIRKGVTDSQKVAQLVEEDYVPVISAMPGFVAHYFVDAGDGVVLSSSVFEHKDAEEQSTFLAGEFVAEDLGSLSPNPPQITAGEVVAYKGR
jgi:hypothetical protein